MYCVCVVSSMNVNVPYVLMCVCVYVCTFVHVCVLYQRVMYFFCVHTYDTYIHDIHTYMNLFQRG